MTIIKSWGGLGVPVPTTVDTTTAGTGDTVFQSVTGTPPVTANFLLRWPSLKFDQLAAASTFVGWTIPASLVGSCRVYARYTALPAASITIFEGRRSGNTLQAFRVDIAGSGGAPPGEIRIRDAANVQVADSGATGIPVGGDFIAECIWNNGTLTVNVYLIGVQTPAFSVSGAIGANAVDHIRMGNVLSATTAPTFYFDDLAVSDTATPIPQVGAGSSDPSAMRPLVYNLNRVAGTIVNGVPTLGPNGAANRWAFTTGLELVHALNVKAGNSLPNFKDLLGVCNQLAGTTGLGEDGASSRWASG